MRHARQTVKLNVVASGVACQTLHNGLAQLLCVPEIGSKIGHGLLRCRQNAVNQRVVLPTFGNPRQAVMQGINQRTQAFGVGQ